ncbi:protein CD300H-like [Meles meles]|uniref:protein CD300H-like n=1 Tax=Meles meles TaxID=9662 RepID=UPI001E699402|nr:protein CD300H-like [Meles meles]
MTPEDGRLWLAAALLLLQFPGCWSLRVPISVMGTVGGSVSVQCQYEEEFRENAKYWCRSPCVWTMVKTKRADREVRKGRVSIRDHPANLTFTVTLESLTEDDAGTYQCGIDTSVHQGYLLDLTFPVVLSVTPGGAWTCPDPPTWDTATQQESSTSSQHPGTSLESHPIEDQASEGEERSLLSSVHFLLLILLKVPLFLMMLSAVLWVNRPQWAICGHQSQPDEDKFQPSLPIHILSRDNTT